MSTVSSLSLANSLSSSTSSSSSSASKASSTSATDTNAILKNATVSGSGSMNFLDTSSDTAVTKLLNAEKTKTTQTVQGNYFYSEDYLRAQANEIHARIVTFQNLGLTSQYQQAEQEGQVVVQEYQALQKATALGTDPVAAIKAVQKAAQLQSFGSPPNVLVSA